MNKKNVKIIRKENIKIYDYGWMMYVVGSGTNIESFFHKSGFKLKKGSIDDTRFSCVYTQKKMIATNFDYVEELHFQLANIPVEVKYNENEIVFSIYKEGDEKGIKKGKGMSIPFK